MSYYINPNFYSIERKFPKQNRRGYLRLDMNENPEGLPKEFVDKVLSKVDGDFLAAYPEPDRFEKKYSSFIGVEKCNVMATNGSDMGIRYLFETFGKPNSEVVTVSPTFEMYWVNCMLMGLKHKPVMYNDDLTIDIDRIIGAINENTSIVILLNPNNPIGNAYEEKDVVSIIDKAKSVNSIVIIDEAYHYFYDKTFLRIVMENENVVMLRTFSKLFSLAACRLGVIVGNKKIISYVKQSKLSFEVNSLALLFGEMIIDEPELISKLIDSENQGKEYIIDAFIKNNYEYKSGLGNYVFFKPKTNPKDLEQRLKDEKRVLVHTYGNELLKEYVRVSVGSVEIMHRFLSALQEVDV